MMKLPIQNNYINGQWLLPELDLNQDLFNANTAEVIGSQFASSPKQVDKAINVAYQAFNQGDWSELSYELRADYLDVIADKLSQKATDIAILDSLQTGVIQPLTEKFGLVCSLAFKGAAQMLRDLDEQQELKGANDNDIIVERLPLGVAAIIAPWNAPSGIACHKISSALAAGCTVLFKPSEWAAGSAQIIAKAIIEADLPKGTFQLLHGDAKVGAHIVDDARVNAVSFTGGAAGGKAIGASCGGQIKAAQLELGGNNALVVLADADLEQAANGIVTGLTTMNAQWCRALGRLVVDEEVKQDLLALVKQKFSQIKMGSSLSSETQMGPLIHQGHLTHIEKRVAEYQQMGGNVIQLTQTPKELSGWFYPATLIDGLNSADTVEEIFGPVATIHTFNLEQEAINIANETSYGLAAYVFGEEKNAWRVARRLRAGVVKINDVSLFALRPDLPRAAWGKSGLGDEGTKETFEFFRGTRVVGVA